MTLSRARAEWAEKAVAEAGLAERVQIRYQDYRDLADGPFDAISSIGMFEHVGLSQLRSYFGRLRRLLRPSGRLLNHGISRPPKALPAEQLHRPLRLPRRRAPPGRRRGPTGRLRAETEAVFTARSIVGEWIGDGARTACPTGGPTCRSTHETGEPCAAMTHGLPNSVSLSHELVRVSDVRKCPDMSGYVRTPL